MGIIKAKQLVHEYIRRDEEGNVESIQTALDHVDLDVQPGQFIAILGHNGSGKSTLLKIITGHLSADNGEVILSGGTTVGYLAQNQEYASEHSIYDEMRDAKPEIIQLEQQMEKLSARMDIETGEALEQVIKQYDNARQRYERLDGYAYQSELVGVLKGLGFTEEDFEKPVISLSGGEKTRVALAKMLLQAPDLIILDEPTNHMDIQAKETLESAFQAYEGTILFVSHDRYFIRQVAKSVLIFENNAAFYYPFGYEHYLERKEKEASGEPLAARIKAEEQALIEGLKAVPRAERHRLREIPEEEAYDQWRLRLAAEAIENAAEQVEGLWQQILEKNGKREERELEHWDHPVNEIADKNEDAACGEKQEKQAEEELSAFTEQYENAQSAWTDACLFWYDIWCEAHPEPVMDPGTSDTDGSVPQDTESSKTDGSEI